MKASSSSSALSGIDGALALSWAVRWSPVALIASWQLRVSVSPGTIVSLPAVKSDPSSSFHDAHVGAPRSRVPEVSVVSGCTSVASFQ